MIDSKIEFDRNKMINWLDTRLGMNAAKELFQDDAIKYAVEHKQYPFIYSMAGERHIRYNVISAILLLAGVDDLLDNIDDTVYDSMFNLLPLTHIKVPFNIASIGMKAFANNKLLTDIYLPDIGFISQFAFQGCDNISSIYIDANKNIHSKEYFRAVFPNVFKIEFKDGVLEL